MFLGSRGCWRRVWVIFGACCGVMVVFLVFLGVLGVILGGHLGRFGSHLRAFGWPVAVFVLVLCGKT